MSHEFCALSTKLKAMRSGALSPAEYDQLLEKHSVNEVCSFLKNTAYGPYLSDLNERDVHRNVLEERIARRYQDQYLKLYVFVGLEQRKLIQFFFMRSEIDLIKRALRKCFNHEQLFVMRMDEAKNEFFTKHSNINTELLLQSCTLNSVAEACKNTIYFSILRQAISTNADYPAIHMMLDRFYFKMLWSTVDHYVEKSQRDDLQKYIGTQIDYMNVMWIYRCKRYFKMPNELIYTYLIPVYYRLSKEEISEMVEAPNMEACEKVILKGRYKDILNTDGNIFLIERNYKKIWYKSAKKAYKLHPQTMIEVFAFFDLCLLETENLKTVIEGIRYQTDPELVRKYIYID